MGMQDAQKQPVFVESGKRGARKRWGAPRVVRLDGLTEAQRDHVVALVDAMREAGQS